MLLGTKHMRSLEKQVCITGVKLHFTRQCKDRTFARLTYCLIIFRLSNFHCFVDSYSMIEEATPPSRALLKALKDRKKGDRRLNSWVAMVAVGVTLFFGLVQSIEVRSRYTRRTIRRQIDDGDGREHAGMSEVQLNVLPRDLECVTRKDDSNGALRCRFICMYIN
jgi:hypothetical protein